MMGTKLLVTAFNAFPAVKPHLGSAVGGVETFAWSLSRSAAKQKDLDVSFFVRDPLPLKVEAIDQVNVVNVIEPLHRTTQQAVKCVRRVHHFPYVKMMKWNPKLIWQIPVVAA